MFDLIIGIDPRAERLALEGIVKEFAAFVSGAYNAESVANHFCAVALESGCMLTAFAAFYAFVCICAGMRTFVAVDMHFTGCK
jgi:hypothetical protein